MQIKDILPKIALNLNAQRKSERRETSLKNGKYKTNKNARNVLTHTYIHMYLTKVNDYKSLTALKMIKQNMCKISVKNWR